MLSITSTAFQAGESIPKEYTCDGPDLNPPLSFSSIPGGTESLVLIVDDPDAPSGIFTHWLLYDIDPATTEITEGMPPETGFAGLNSSGKTSYTGPCPPSGMHRYMFKLFALDRTIDLPRGATKQEVLAAMDAHIIESAELTGTYTKQ